MFCRAIPIQRTPGGIEFFDYRVPAGMDVRVGSLVRVPFRRGVIPALVHELASESAFADQAADIADTYADIVFPPELIRLLDWTAERTFSSKPTVLKAWLRNLPKREPDTPVGTLAASRGSGVLKSTWSTEADRLMLEHILQSKETRRVLLLTPLKHRALAYGGKLKADVLTSDTSDGDAFRAWTAFASSKDGLLVATRVGAWLMPMADLVVVDEPEHDDHKQEDMAPRFDARRMAAFCAQQLGVDVEGFGLTPPLHVTEQAPEIKADVRTFARDPKGRSNVPAIQADALNILREHQGPLIVIHPIKGSAARFTCRDCGWQLACPRCAFPASPEGGAAVCRRCDWRGEAPPACGRCGGSDLGKSLPGIDRLRDAMSKHEPELRIDWRDTSPASLESPLPEGALVLVTDGESLAGGGVEDVRRLERLVVAYRRLANAVARVDGSLLIQSSDAHLSDWHAWLAADGFSAFRERERHGRSIFGYPPAGRLYKAIVRGDQTMAERWGREAERLFASRAELRGPFPVPFQPKSRTPRFIWHVLPKADVSERELMPALAKLSARALIDLDPIAFFR